MKKKFDISKMKKTGEFKVPDSYFDELSVSIIDKISSKSSYQKGNILLLGNYKKLAIAASILIIAGLILTNILINDKPENRFTKTEKYLLNQVDSEFLIEFIADNNMMELSEFDELVLDEFDIFDESILIEEL